MVKTKDEIIDILLEKLQIDETVSSKESFHKLKNAVLAEYGDPASITSIDLIERYRSGIASGFYREDSRIWKVLRKRAVRSLSGVAVISLLTKFWGCPGKCIYCPTYEGLPKSYITNEPAVQRAEMNEFDPFRQIQNRLQSLSMTGNAISKCDVRIIGGTWSVYPREYQEEFIKQVYDAHTSFSLQPITKETSSDGTDISQSPFTSAKRERNDNFTPSKTLEEAKKRNETALSRVIGVAIETRPDWIDETEIQRLRRYGVTRVEIGYQTTDDQINTLNQRGHGNAESIKATKLLKDAGFKVVAHMMPGLVGATPEGDKKSMQEVFDNPDFRPDEIKIYPMVVTPHSELEGLWREGNFTPYDDITLIDLMAEIQSYLPEYVRLNRMYRDIPASEILAGSKLANLRQLTEARMIKRGLSRHDISAREIRAKGNNPANAILEEYFYEASDGHEYFIQYIDPLDRTIFALARLRIPSVYFSGESHFIEELENAAIIREVHVFGDQLKVGESSNGGGQHMGFGRKMIRYIEDLVKEKYSKIDKIGVISGVGAKPYYEKLGYIPVGEYMIRYLSDNMER